MVKPLKGSSNILDRIRAKQARVQQFSGRTPSGIGHIKTDTPADKGRYLGACNRSSCLAPGANWYNWGSHAYYCESCADWLSSDHVNKRDARSQFGHDLCTEGKREDYLQRTVVNILPRFQEYAKQYSEIATGPALNIHTWIYESLQLTKSRSSEHSSDGSLYRYYDALAENEEVQKLYAAHQQKMTVATGVTDELQNPA
jgi:hypothetical protein